MPEDRVEISPIFIKISPKKLRNQIKLEKPSSSQFHRHFTYKFFVQTLFQKLFSSDTVCRKCAKTTFVQKNCTKNFVRKMLMKLTPELHLKVFNKLY